MSSDIIEGIIKGFQLIFSMDPTLVEITFRSLLVSGLATLMSLLWSIPIGILVGLGNFQGRSIFKSIFNALTGVPTVSLGLILYLLLSHRGVLGFLGLLYTPWAIIIGQALLITPIVISMVVSRLESTDPSIEELALTLGASDLQVKITILREAISGLLLAVTVSFNRALSELGVALMLGGNIRGVSRVLTTTIALETNRGHIALSIALATVLIVIVAGVSLTVNHLERRFML